MSSLSRILQALNWEEPDQVPVMPVLLLHGAKELKMSLPQYFQKTEYMVEGQTRLLEKYGYDAVYGFPHVVEDIEPFGGNLSYFESGPPTIGKMAWRNWSDIESMHVPIPSSNPSLVKTLKTIEQLAAKFKGEKLIVGAAIAPFSLPSMLIGTEKWIELLWEDELIRGPILKRVLDICSKFCIDWSNAQIQAGADVVVLADGIASATCIMREQFESFALPVIKQTIKGISGNVAYEPVGHIEPFIDLLGDIGTSLILLESGDNVAKCKRMLQGKVAMMGNINNIAMIQWNRATMLQQCKFLLDEVASGGGFILSSQGPEVAWDTPDEVIHALVEAARSWRKS